MSYQITKTDAEIDDLIQQCMDAEEQGTTKFRGMTYEQGIKNALDWVVETGQDGYHPLDD